MDKRKFSKIFALMCALVLMVGMCSTIVLAQATLSNPITVNGKTYDNDKTAPENYDISVMSYNILQSGSGNYDYPDQRLNYVVTNIQVYEPDIIGIQEASHTKLTASDGSTFYWDTALPAALTQLGYSALYIGTQNGTNTSSIGYGLFIFYKDRFTMTDSGYENFNASYTYTLTDGTSASSTDKGRWFQWAKFTDTTYGNELYFYNTHLSVNPSKDNVADSELTYAGNQIRTQQLATMLADINTRAAATPCFIAGDFNTSISHASTTEGVELLGLMSNYPYLSDSATVADATISANPKGRIDHIYFNDNYAKAIEHRAVQENIGGRAASDHFALVSYLNYSAAATINGNAYDEVNGTYTETVDSTSFTFNIADTTQAQNLTWTINGSSASTVTLSKVTNTYPITFYYNGTKLNTITATIQYTGATKPTLTATGAQNSYFANGAYQVIAGSDTVKLSVQNATLYNGETSLGTSYSFTPAAGRTELALTYAGETYPIYIYKATKNAESGKVLYVDDDMTSSGIVPYYNGTDVVLVTAGEQGFATIGEAAAICTDTEGYTIYVGSGSYKGNLSSIPFAKGITLLGANYGISALKSDSAKTLNPDRKEESVILDSFIYGLANTDGMSYTVRGFTFDGYLDTYETIHGFISLYASFSTTQEKVNSIMNVDIRDNIFVGYGNASNDAGIFINSGIQVMGLIANNYFKYNGNEGARDNRAIQIRNINGLIIENNRFLNFPSPMWLSSEYATECDDYAGYFNLTVQNNIFEACQRINNHLKNIDSTTNGDIRYLNNSFIRCGYYTGGNAIIYMYTTAAIATQNLAITIQDNDFLGCLYSISLTRASQTESITDFSKIKLNINSNRFYQPQERGKTQSTNLKNTMNFGFLVSATDSDGDTYYDFEQDVSENWSLKYNYFYSDIYTDDSSKGNTYYVYTDGRSVYDPSLYINNTVKRSADSTSGACIALSEDIYTPYYTDEAMTVLSYGSQPAQDISVADVDVIYDGEAHSITVPAADNSTVTYSTDGITYSSINPSFSEVGVYPVYWMVETPGYAAAGGIATVTIYELLDQNIEYSDQTYVYNGSAQGAAIQVAQDATITYTTNGGQSTVAPTFTEAGTYSVSFTVTRKYYKDFSGTYTVTIENAPLDSVALVGYSGAYDGKAHGVTVGTLPKGVTAAFAIDGKTVENAFTDVGEYAVTVTLSGNNYTTRSETVTVSITPASLGDVAISGYSGYYDGKAHSVTVGALPDGVTAAFAINGNAVENSFTDVGNYAVTVTLSGVNYVPRSETVTVNIVDAIITGVTITPYVGEVDGQSHGVTVQGIQEGDTVYYAYNGADYTTEEPAFTKEGRYTITVKIVRENYQDKISVVTVVIDESLREGYIPPMFSVINDNFAVSESNGKYSFKWDCTLDFTEFGGTALSKDEYRILSYGVKYSPTLENLEEYIYDYQINGYNTTGTVSGKVAEIAVETAKDNDNFLTHLYKTTHYQLNSISELRARYAMSYVRYYKTNEPSVIYEEYGAIEIAISNYLPDGTINGIGGTAEREDILGTSPDEGKTSEREDILEK